jgi:hypothetical protein
VAIKLARLLINTGTVVNGWALLVTSACIPQACSAMRRSASRSACVANSKPCSENRNYWRHYHETAHSAFRRLNRSGRLAAISWRALSDCKGVKGIVCAGWSELDTRKIYIQAAMTWTPQLLLIAVEHEYGHMLMGSAHSLDPNSVMFSIVHEGQHIQADDRMWAGKLAERPTILRKD